MYSGTVRAAMLPCSCGTTLGNVVMVVVVAQVLGIRHRHRLLLALLLGLVPRRVRLGGRDVCEQLTP